MIFTSFLEVISIGAVIPFLAIITAPEKVFNYEYIKPIIGALNFHQPQDLLLPLTLLFVAAIITSTISRITLLWLQNKLAYAIGADFSYEIYRQALYQPYQVHLSKNTSQLIATVFGKSVAVISSGMLPLLNIASSAFMLVFIMSTLIMIDAQVAIIALSGFGLIYILITLATKKQLAANSEKISSNLIKAVKTVQEGLGGIRDVLIDGTQETYATIFRTADVTLRHAQVSNAIIGNIPRYLIEALGISLIVLLAFSFSTEEQNIVQAIPVLGAFVLGAQRLLPVMQQIYQSWSNLKSGQASLNEVLNLVSQPPQNYLKQSNPEPIKFEDSISINNVSFCYANDDKEVLHKISIHIKKGSRVGFMGATGSGKSTLLDIIMGLLQPTDGVLEIDGRAITEKNHRAWQAIIAHVPQAIFLADISIAENIAFGVPPEKINMLRVKEAARQAQISQIIETWEEQYDTLVGEQGVRLSGGQRQRIGIARALYKKSKVIIFDEATSALDSKTEALLMKEIYKISKEITILIIAHRLSTLKECDVVYELTKRAEGESQIRVSREN
jgi:ATP-binding cassette subfamily B protein